MIARISLSSSIELAFFTPFENEPSGIFNTTGSPN